MRTPALPLQILLALALLLNGIGGAMTGVLAAVPGPQAPVKAHMGAEAPMDPASPCHEQAGYVPGFAEVPAAHPSDCHSDGDTPCGDSAECLQACLHASVALPPLLLATSVDASPGAAVHPLASGHPAPLLRSPTRPPIA